MKSKIITIPLITLATIILWVFVNFSGVHSTNLTIPVKIVNMPEKYMLNTLSNETIELSIQGEGWQLAQITFGSNPTLNIPVLDESKNKTVAVRAILGQSSWLSSGIQIVSLNPERIEYSIEKTKSKVVRIVNNVSVELKPGYGRVSEISVVPDTVRIYGARSRIDTITSVSTEDVVLKEVDQFISEEIGLEAMPNISFNSEFCRIEFDVQKIVDKTFENVIIETIQVPRDQELLLEPPEVKVIIRGGIKNLGKFNREDFKLFVNFRDALADTMGSVVPQIELPEYFSLTDIRPGKIKYVIKQN
jgi:YbbR domain-containing protein